MNKKNIAGNVERSLYGNTEAKRNPQTPLWVDHESLCLCVFVFVEALC
jgi:hypothetical protein